MTVAINDIKQWKLGVLRLYYEKNCRISFAATVPARKLEGRRTPGEREAPSSPTYESDDDDSKHPERKRPKKEKKSAVKCPYCGSLFIWTLNSSSSNYVEVMNQNVAYLLI